MLLVAAAQRRDPALQLVSIQQQQQQQATVAAQTTTSLLKLLVVVAAVAGLWMASVVAVTEPQQQSTLRPNETPATGALETPLAPTGTSDTNSNAGTTKSSNNNNTGSSNATATTYPPVLELNAFQAAQYGFFRHPPGVSVIIAIGYTIVFVVGIVGNSFVVALVCKSPRMRTVTNYFIANLAFADILVLLFCLPATLMSNLFIPYVLGLFVCKTVSYLQGVAVSASINTMVAVTMDRFLAICFPMDRHMSRRTARWTIAGIWLYSLAILLPWVYYFTLIPHPFENLTIQVCAEEWPSERMGAIYFVCANLILLYLLPATVIILCYMGIWYKIKRRNIPGEGRPKIELIMQKSKLKVVKMMMVVVVIFLLSWLPLYIIWARIKLSDEANRSAWEDWLITKMMPLAQWLGASNSCINPILYTFFNRRYKRGFIDLLRFGFCCKPLIQEACVATNGGGAAELAAMQAGKSHRSGGGGGGGHHRNHLANGRAKTMAVLDHQRGRNIQMHMMGWDRPVGSDSALSLNNGLSSDPGESLELAAACRRASAVSSSGGAGVGGGGHLPQANCRRGVAQSAGGGCRSLPRLHQSSGHLNSAAAATARAAVAMTQGRRRQSTGVSAADAPANSNELAAASRRRGGGRGEPDAARGLLLSTAGGRHPRRGAKARRAGQGQPRGTTANSPSTTNGATTTDGWSSRPDVGGRRRRRDRGPNQLLAAIGPRPADGSGGGSLSVQRHRKSKDDESEPLKRQRRQQQQQPATGAAGVAIRSTQQQQRKLATTKHSTSSWGQNNNNNKNGSSSKQHKNGGSVNGTSSKTRQKSKKGRAWSRSTGGARSLKSNSTNTTRDTESTDITALSLTNGTSANPDSKNSINSLALAADLPPAQTSPSSPPPPVLSASGTEPAPSCSGPAAAATELPAAAGAELRKTPSKASGQYSTSDADDDDHSAALLSSTSGSVCSPRGDYYFDDDDDDDEADDVSVDGDYDEEEEDDDDDDDDYEDGDDDEEDDDEDEESLDEDSDELEGAEEEAEEDEVEAEHSLDDNDHDNNKVISEDEDDNMLFGSSNNSPDDRTAAASENPKGSAADGSCGQRRRQRRQQQQQQRPARPRKRQSLFPGEHIGKSLAATGTSLVNVVIHKLNSCSPRGAAAAAAAPDSTSAAIRRRRRSSTSAPDIGPPANSTQQQPRPQQNSANPPLTGAATAKLEHQPRSLNDASATDAYYVNDTKHLTGPPSVVFIDTAVSAAATPEDEQEATRSCPLWACGYPHSAADIVMVAAHADHCEGGGNNDNDERKPTSKRLAAGGEPVPSATAAAGLLLARWQQQQQHRRIPPLPVQAQVTVIHSNPIGH